MYKNLFSCQNKVALVTGGAGLIGMEIVKGLKEFGAFVYVADIEENKALKLADTSQVQFVSLDINSEQSVKNAVGGILKQHKHIDILVNSAYPRTVDWNVKFENVSYESLITNIKSHLGGYFLCCKTVAELMKEYGGGSIINIASIYGMTGPDFSIYEGTEMTMPAAYSAIKGGIIAFTKYLATYYAKFNVRVNCISPGGIFNGQPESFVKKYSDKVPLGRMAKKDEIVGGVIYLASDASSYVTGTNVVIDGGWTAW